MVRVLPALRVLESRETTARPQSPSAARQVFDDEAVTQFESIQRAARRLTHNRSEADDLAQETYVRALDGADRFRVGTNLRAWLFTILRHTHLNRRRGAARSIVEVDGTKVDRFAERCGHEDTPEQRLLRDSRQSELKQALDSLPPALGRTLWLRDVEERSYAEIAHELRIPVGTVMSRLSRARHLLYARLKK